MKYCLCSIFDFEDVFVFGMCGVGLCVVYLFGVLSCGVCSFGFGR